MEHVVFSAAVDGAGEEFRRVSSLEEAVRVVEHLRNDLGIEGAEVCALTPVPLAFRTYYRVEVPGAESDDSSGSDELEVPAVAPVLALAEVASMPALAAVAEEAAFAAGEESGFESDFEADDAPAHLEALPDLGMDAEMEVPELEDLPAMPSPGLQPRGSDLIGAVDGDSEHSLGYFAR